MVLKRREYLASYSANRSAASTAPGSDQMTANVKAPAEPASDAQFALTLAKATKAAAANRRTGSTAAAAGRDVAMLAAAIAAIEEGREHEHAPAYDPPFPRKHATDVLVIEAAAPGAAASEDQDENAQE